MKNLLFSALFLTTLSGFAQQIPQKYFVAFTDKTGTPYTIGNPQAFLTQRSINRRNAQGIPITSEDLPLTPAYVEGVAATGAEIYTRSKWFNGVTVRVVDSSILSAVRSLPYVQSVLRVTSYSSGKSILSEHKFSREGEIDPSHLNVMKKEGTSASDFNYGPSLNQIQMIKGDYLHSQGYRGQGMVIAVLDAGFLNADTNHVFDSLRASNQILGTRDFVEPYSSKVYTAHPHGAAVLSLMGGNTPGQLIGTAPKASYWLIRTEDGATENIIEEYNWVVGAEMADSVGADVINSSLGYTMFDNGYLSHDCASMDGVTNPSTRGANIAANKGMALSISAGNEGGSGWLCVSSPSDAVNALSIAAVDASGAWAHFSSTGNINGEYVKPNIATQGQSDYFCNTDGTFGYGSGTSFSSPVNAGTMACLWQARPQLTQSDLRKVIEESASQYAQPDTLLGYGIPDYQSALKIPGISAITDNGLTVVPNPFTDGFNIFFNRNVYGTVNLSLISLSGDVVFNIVRSISGDSGQSMGVKTPESLDAGMYILKVSTSNSLNYLHMVKVYK